MTAKVKFQYEVKFDGDRTLVGEFEAYDDYNSISMALCRTYRSNNPRAVGYKKNASGDITAMKMVDRRKMPGGLVQGVEAIATRVQ